MRALCTFAVFMLAFGSLWIFLDLVAQTPTYGLFLFSVVRSLRPVYPNPFWLNILERIGCYMCPWCCMHPIPAPIVDPRICVCPLFLASACTLPLPHVLMQTRRVCRGPRSGIRCRRHQRGCRGGHVCGARRVCRGTPGCSSPLFALQTIQLSRESP